MVDVIDTGTVDLESPTLIEGFPGVGLVGTIATQYMYRNLELEQVAKMDSDDFPPVAVVQDGVVRLPVRIYQEKKHDLLLVVSELPIHPAISNDVAGALVNWSKEHNVERILSLAGVGTMENMGRKFAAATRKELLDEVPDDIESFNDGNISGISGSIMVNSSLNDLDAICILGEAQVFAPDPRAASDVIETLNEMFSLGVDVSELLEQAEQIESQMQQLAKQTKKAHEEGEQETPTPIMYG